MSCPEADSESASGPGSATAANRRPEHNWRPTVVHGAALWLLLGVAAALPLSGPVEFGIAVAAVFVVPVLPVALCCDYLQARAYNECSPGVTAYASNLWQDVQTTVVHRTPLGSDRQLLSC